MTTDALTIVIPEPARGEFDVDQTMVKTPFSSPGYHTTLRGGDVHPTRETLEYAADLWASDTSFARERAIQILQRVLPLQDQIEASKTYGLWSWFLEEPLTQMAPPDWNWADFCARPLLEIASTADGNLPDPIASQVDAAIGHCARSIQRRNIDPGYTNIAIMGTYVTLAAGQHLQWKEMLAYAMDRLERFYAFTLEHGSLVEYNSPTYTVVALEELTRLRSVCRTPRTVEIADALLRLTWQEIADHFHEPTAQWAGPHSRCYSTLLERDRLVLLEKASKGRLSFSSTDHSIRPPRIWDSTTIPPDLLPRFQSLSHPREVVKTFDRIRGPIIGTTYHHPKFVLGSANYADLWRQQRPLLAYWGSQEHPSFLRLRLMRNGDDLHAGELHCVQREGAILAGLGIASDQGLIHSYFGRIQNHRLSLQDLRIRFELGGAAASTALSLPPALNDIITFNSQGVHVQLQCPYVEFGSITPRWEIKQLDNVTGLDLVLFNGPEREFDLSSMDAVAACIALHMGNSHDPAIKIDLKVEPEVFAAKYDSLALSFPRRPMHREDFRKKAP